MSESVENSVPAGPQACRTHFINILAAPWKCGPCGRSGHVFDPNKLKELKEKGECAIECPHCKAIVKLFISKIITPPQGPRS